MVILRLNEPSCIMRLRFLPLDTPIIRLPNVPASEPDPLSCFPGPMRRRIWPDLTMTAATPHGGRATELLHEKVEDSSGIAGGSCTSTSTTIPYRSRTRIIRLGQAGMALPSLPASSLLMLARCTRTLPAAAGNSTTALSSR